MRSSRNRSIAVGTIAAVLVGTTAAACGGVGDDSREGTINVTHNNGPKKTVVSVSVETTAGPGDFELCQVRVTAEWSEKDGKVERTLKNVKISPNDHIEENELLPRHTYTFKAETFGPTEYTVTGDIGEDSFEQKFTLEQLVEKGGENVNHRIERIKMGLTVGDTTESVTCTNRSAEASPQSLGTPGAGVRVGLITLA